MTVVYLYLTLTALVFWTVGYLMGKKSSKLNLDDYKRGLAKKVRRHLLSLEEDLLT